MNEMYETKISDIRWLAYDIPGNIGWIIYMICLVLCCKDGLSVFAVTIVIPAVLMLIGVAELVSERIVRLDRVLPKIRLYRGFGALTLGGIIGVINFVIGLVIYSDKILMILMFAGSVLCAVFAGLCFAGYKKQNS